MGAPQLTLCQPEAGPLIDISSKKHTVYGTLLSILSKLADSQERSAIRACSDVFFCDNAAISVKNRSLDRLMVSHESLMNNNCPPSHSVSHALSCAVNISDSPSYANSAYSPGASGKSSHPRANNAEAESSKNPFYGMVW